MDDADPPPDQDRDALLAVASRRLNAVPVGPRWLFSGMLLISGLVAFVCSVLLLAAGVQSMAVRYPLAVGGGYLGFLILLWLWLRGERGESGGTGTDAVELLQAADLVTPRRRSAGPGWWSTLTSSGGKSDRSGGDGDGDLGGLVVAVLVTVAVAAVLFTAVYAIYTAPVLLAELLVDGAVVGALAKRRHWTVTAVARTGWVALALAVLFGLVGFGLEKAAPGSKTVAQAMGLTKKE